METLRKAILNSLHFSGMQALLAPYTGGMGSIMMLHHVRNQPNSDFSPNYHLSVSPEFVEQIIIRYLNKGFEFISMDEVAERLEDPKAYRDAKPFLAMTLDDGYSDNLENAVPVFRRHGVPYTIYIAPGITDCEASLWWEALEAVIAKQSEVSIKLTGVRRNFDLSTADKKHKAYKFLSDYLTHHVSEDEQRHIISELVKEYDVASLSSLQQEAMNWEELKKLSTDPLCTLGAHTVGHYALGKLDKERARWEMLQSRDIIRTQIGIEPRHFAYPYGFPSVVGKREFDLAAECGFLTAVTTRHGVIYPQHNEHMTALPRVSINGHYQAMKYIDTLVSGTVTWLSNRGKKLNVG